MGFERMGLQCLYRPVLLATIRMRRDFDVVRGFGVVRFRLPTPQLPAAVLTAIAALASTLEGMVFRPGVWDGRGLHILGFGNILDGDVPKHNKPPQIRSL